MLSSGIQCFICDEIINGKGVPLLMGCTPYTNTGLPTKIGQLMGDSFMVIVAVSDMLCKRCSSLINHLDKLEFDLEHVRKSLTGYLKVKYKLDDDYDSNENHSVPQCEDIPDFNGYIPTEDNASADIVVKDNISPSVPTSKDVKPSISELRSRLLRTDEIKKEKRSTLNEDGDNDLNSASYEHSLFEQTAIKDKWVGYECTSCNYKTSDLEAFTMHLKSHSKKIYYKCSECCQKFESQEEVENHVLKGHSLLQVKSEVNQDSLYQPSPRKIYECNICKYRHPDKRVFDLHLHKHVKLEFFTCEICSRRFKHKITLKKHMSTHRTFKCTLCSVTFQNKVSLVHHFTQFHEDDAENYSTEQNSEEAERMNCEFEVHEVITIEDDAQVMHSEVKIEEVKSLALPDAEPDAEPNSVKKAEYDEVEDLLEKMHSEEPQGEEELAESLPEVEEQVECSEREKNIKEEQNVLEPEITVEMSEEIHEEELVHNEVKGYLEDSSNYMDDSQSDGEQDSIIKQEDLNKDGQLFRLLEDGTLVLEEAIKVDVSYENEEEEEQEQESGVQIEEDLKSQENPDQSEVSETMPPVKRRIYVCSLCGLRTPSEPHMKRHFKCHIALERKIYKCHICERVLTTHSNLKRHLSLHDRCTSGVVECKMCFKKLHDRLTLKHHMEVKHLLTHQCSFCEQRFESRKLCQEHELSHPTLPCDVCNKLFLTEGRLKNHREVMHGDPNQPISCDKTYKCHICLKFLTTYHNLKRHLRNHERCSGAVTCSLCSEELTDRLHLRQHVEDKHPESHQCPFCHKVFSNKRSCKAHELSHPERFVYKCDKCEKVFLTEVRLKRHKDIIHRDPHCRVCGKEITNPVKLLDHERRHERHKEKFPCDQCPKIFRTPSGLKYHMSVHTGKYAVYCEICGKGLHSEVVLEEHKATHTKEVRYMCELCGRKFSSNSTYRMHRLWHDNPLPYKCNICDRKFKHTSILAVHKRRAHTGERPYKCPYCSLTFSVSSTLNKHVILHTKQYPFRCEQCNKGFTTRTKIARHLAKVHNDFEMLNAQKKRCEYKMVLMPSELPDMPLEEQPPTVQSLPQPAQSMPEIKGEVEDETHTATLQVLQLQEVTVDESQGTVYTIFQPDLQVNEEEHEMVHE